MCLLCDKTPHENIKELTICNNYVGSIPDTLVKLQFLYCSDTQLSGSIPDTLVKLCNLDCRNTQISGSIPDTLVELRYLNCYNTQISGSIPNTFVKLWYINCSNTSISGSIPNTLVRLYYLYCSDTQISDIFAPNVSEKNIKGCLWLNKELISMNVKPLITEYLIKDLSNIVMEYLTLDE